MLSIQEAHLPGTSHLVWLSNDESARVGDSHLLMHWHHSLGSTAMSGKLQSRKRKAEGDQLRPRPPFEEECQSGAQSGQESLNGPLRRSYSWTPEEDNLLRAAVEKYGCGSWKSIAKVLKHRTDTQCMSRWQRVLDPNVNKGPWTKEEDARLTELVAQYGKRDWSLIASHMPGRINKQCRERWSNQLDPSIKRGAWSPEEDALIARLQAELGNQWAQIARHLPGRTDNAIKNRWNATIFPRIQKGTLEVPAASNASLEAAAAGQGAGAATPAASSVACSPPPLFQASTQQQPQQAQQARGGRPGLRSFGRAASCDATLAQLQFSTPEARPPQRPQLASQQQAASGRLPQQGQQAQQGEQQGEVGALACEASRGAPEASSSQAAGREPGAQQQEQQQQQRRPAGVCQTPPGGRQGSDALAAAPPQVLGVQTRRRQRQLILAVPPGSKFPFQPPVQPPAPAGSEQQQRQQKLHQHHRHQQQQEEERECVVDTPQLAGVAPAGSSRGPARAQALAQAAQPSSDSAGSCPPLPVQGGSNGGATACTG